MNSAVVTKIEYRIFPETEFSTLDIVPYSGKLSEPFKKDENGNSYYDCSVQFKIAKIDSTKDTLLKSVVNRKGQYRVTDANGTIYLVGDDTTPARLSYTSELSGTPGSFNGYTGLIKCNSINGSSIES